MQFMRDIYRILWLNKREDYLHLCHIYILQHSVLLWTGGISILISRILSERCEELEKELNNIQVQLTKLPSGKLICTRNGASTKWYVRDNDILTYLPKQKRSFAEQLAVRKYLTLRVDELLQEKEAIDSYFRHLSRPKYKSTKLLEAGSPYLELMSSYFTCESQDLLHWAQAPYAHNQQYVEQCIHKTSSGNLVRSKSEAIIDMLLSINKIPFRYECELRLKGTVIFPDFTIRHPITGKYYYWEHLGMMDEAPYYTNAYDKLKLYAANGILPGLNLILTCETKAKPLSTETVERTISNYFL